MPEVDCDFHIHGKYSAATSGRMDLETISKQASLKGLGLVGTGDALHPGWLSEIRLLNRFSDGIYEKNGCKFALTTEVEDARRVHHLILLPSLSSAESLSETFGRFSRDIAKDGRPHLALSGAEVLDYVAEVGGLLGPSHAFVPWTSVYKEYDGLAECYGRSLKKVGFLELGLSADTDMADMIEELAGLTFMSNSDAHSPWPHRLGREFNRVRVDEVSFDGIKKAIFRKGKNRFTLNVGLDQRLGKYHRTACIKCYTLYRLKDAVAFNWKCRKCGGTLKKGVFDRIGELTEREKPVHPDHRPPYIRIAPLAEIICLAMGIKSPYSSKVQGAWERLVTRFGSEIRVLIDVPVGEIGEVGGEKIARLIGAFRRGDFHVLYGGGGHYGEVVFDRRPREQFYHGDQSSLDDY
jgi:uncharacterized protein (TIGR00375 family)